MKNVKTILTGGALILLFSFSQCKKNKNAEPQLPPETTTGAMTFGCKVNGKVFVPRDGRGRPGLFCQYVNLGSGPGGGWYLNVSADNWQPSTPEGITISTDSLLIIEGSTYPFKYRKKGFPGVLYSNGSRYDALDNNSGELTIRKFDAANRIISGTFFFTGTNNLNGQTVNITEGRFDIRY
jgi:Family of unknown function (DUF6252)